MVKRHRRLIAGAAILIVWFGSIGGAYYLAAHNAASVVQLCQAGNDARAQQIGLWTYILGISKPPAYQTAAQRRQHDQVVAKFEAHLHHVFAPRNCQHPGR